MVERSMDFDIERLLSPISTEAPAGAPLRYEGTYDRIREARREDDPTLPQGVWVARLKAADWKAVAALCAEALERRSKDLQIAAWLAEAWLHLGGSGALAPGLRLVAALCDRYWDVMVPELGDEGAEARSGLLAWLDEALARTLRSLPLAELGEGRAPYRLVDWDTGRRPGDGEDAFARVALLDRARWAALEADVRAGLAAADALSQALAARLDGPPPMHRTRAALRSLGAFVGAIGGGSTRDVSAPAPDAEISAPGGPPASAAAGAPDAPIGSRVEAYRRLAQAADYLLRTEPHSPVPYLVKRAITWGNMSLAELLAEFVSSTDDLVTMYRLLGMRRNDEA